MGLVVVAETDAVATAYLGDGRGGGKPVVVEIKAVVTRVAPRAGDASVVMALLAPLVLADQALRVVTWNLETLGPPGSSQYQAVAAVLGRRGLG
jgi:hypothetical protein